MVITRSSEKSNTKSRVTQEDRGIGAIEEEDDRIGTPSTQR